MKIIALEAENFKRLRAVQIRPDGSLVVLHGANGAGKSSILDAVAAALGGKDMAPAVPIRIGQEHAEVTVDLGEYVVTRRWTQAGSTLAVKNQDGARFPSPQALLDKIIGKISFDPLAFIRAKPAEQAEILRRLVGLDFSLVDAQRKKLYEDRTVINREVTNLKGAVARMPVVEAPDDEVSGQELFAELDKRLAQQRHLEGLQRAAQEATRKREASQARLSVAKAAVDEAERRLAAAKADLAEAEKGLIAAEQAEDAAGGACMEADEPDLEGIRKQLAEVDGTNAKVRAKKARAAEQARLAEKEAESNALTVKIEALDAQKAGSIAQAKFPVDGLGFDENGITFNGLPLQQASGAEQLRVSVAVGLALNPRLRLLLIHDGSLLDEDSLRLVAEMAEEADAQVLMERVGKKGEVGILIEDGAVAGPQLAAVNGEVRT